MSRFRFLHAADLHVDSPLDGLDAYEGAPVGAVRSASRRALEHLVREALAGDAAFVVLAGDVFDGTWRDVNTGIFFAKQLARLTAAGIPVVLLRGNHDAESAIGAEGRLGYGDGVHVFGADAPETFDLAHVPVSLHGQSYATAATVDNLAVHYPPPRPGRLNVGVLHTALAGTVGHAPYAPCTEADLVAKGYDYWALGHVHEPKVVRRTPAIVYPGNLQGRHARETGPRGAMWVTAEVDDVGARIVSLDRVILDVVRWDVAEVDVTSIAHVDGVIAAVRAAAGAAMDEARRDGVARTLALRTVLVGETALDGTLRVERERIRNELRALELGGASLYVEKVVVRTRPSAVEASAPDDLEAALDEVLRDGSVADAVRAGLVPLQRQLPPTLREELKPSLDQLPEAALAAALRDDPAALLEDARAYLLGRLRGMR